MLVPYLTMLRPSQWLKNLMLFFPPLLAGYALQPGVLQKGLLPFFAFCLVSSAGYIFNDLIDRERDLLHPQKKLRPIPSGVATPGIATMIAVLLLVSGLLVSASISLYLLFWLAGYAVIALLYSLLLKNLPVADLFCISAGFLVRLQAGGELYQVPISIWLFFTVFLLSMFLSAGKRIGETRSMRELAGDHRSSLARYPEGFLAATMYATGTAVLLTYALYALQKPRLILSVPLCLFGLLRYISRVNSGKSGDPTESLLKDRVLFVVGLVWVVMVVWSIYL